ncbi:23771_t:CDS:2 [Gigaspora rosea]|nr:23771_t:CDS:2 [Gigaspora rosea]
MAAKANIVKSAPPIQRNPIEAYKSIPIQVIGLIRLANTAYSSSLPTLSLSLMSDRAIQMTLSDIDLITQDYKPTHKYYFNGLYYNTEADVNVAKLTIQMDESMERIQNYQNECNRINRMKIVRLENQIEQIEIQEKEINIMRLEEQIESTKKKLE